MPQITPKYIEDALKIMPDSTSNKKTAHRFAARLSELEDQLFARTDEDGRNLIHSCIVKAVTPDGRASESRVLAADAYDDLHLWLRSIRLDLLAQKPPDYAKRLLKNPSMVCRALAELVSGVKRVSGKSEEEALLKLNRELEALEAEPFILDLADGKITEDLLNYLDIDLSPADVLRLRKQRQTKDSLRANIQSEAIRENVDSGTASKYVRRKIAEDKDRTKARSKARKKLQEARKKGAGRTASS